MQSPHEENRTLHPTLAVRQGGVFLFALSIMRGPTAWLTQRLASHFHKRYTTYRHAKLFFAIDLVLVGVVILLTGLAGWTVYQRLAKPAPLAFTVAIHPTAVTSGAPATITLWYENKSQKTINDIVLAIRLPPHVELLRSFPPNFATRTNTLPIGTLAPGARGAAKVTARIWGAIGTPVPVLITAAFTIEGNGKRSIAFEKLEFPIQDSVLATTLVLPDRVLTGQPTPFTFSYENSGEAPLPDVILHPLLPQGAIIQHANQPLAEDAWRIGQVPPGVNGTIQGIIIFQDPPGGATQFAIQSLIIRNGIPLLQDEATIPVAIFETPLTISASVPVAVAKPGTEIPITIRIQNTGDAPLRDISVTLVGSAPKAHPPLAGNPAIDRAALAASIAVPDLLPTQSQTITYPLPIRKRITSSDLKAGDADQKIVIAVRPEARATLADGLPVSLTVRGEELKLPVETPFALYAFAHYYSPEGDQIGRGPLPPQVGKTTKYWITWEFAPTTNEIEELMVRAQLPPFAAWTGEAHATVGRAPRFDSETQTVHWTIDRLAPTLNTGRSIVARFEVALTPTEALHGTIPLILEETVAQAFDEFTETSLTATAAADTTALPHDDYIQGRIRVR